MGHLEDREDCQLVSVISLFAFECFGIFPKLCSLQIVLPLQFVVLFSYFSFELHSF